MFTYSRDDFERMFCFDDASTLEKLFGIKERSAEFVPTLSQKPRYRQRQAYSFIPDLGAGYSEVHKEKISVEDRQEERYCWAL